MNFIKFLPIFLTLVSSIVADQGPVDWYDCKGKRDGNYIHPSDCTKFMTCVAQLYAYERDCSVGLNYDPVNDRCEWPDIVGCITDPPTTITTPTTTTPTTTTPTTTTQEPATTPTEEPTTTTRIPELTTPTDPTTTTTDEPTSTTFETTPSETIPSETTPSETTLSEPTTPERTTTTTDEPPSTTGNPDACDHDCEYVGIDCHNYYSCINFTRKEYHECNAEHGLAFNPALKVCDRIENVEGCRPETTELPTTSPPEENCICEYKPHETDCSKYYFCLDSCRNSSCQVRACPGDLLWSVDFYGDGSAHQQCSLPENANCVSAGAGGALLEFSCYKKANGLYQNERDCKSYWKCEEGQGLLYECAKGYVYNADMKSCDFVAKSLRFCMNNEQL